MAGRPRSQLRVWVVLYVAGMAETALARSFGRVFDGIAAEYDQSRPTYPDELVDRALELAGLGRGDRVLEVGCGTGQLTRSLLARGLHVTAVERGAQLISLAAQKLDGLGDVEFVSAPFEEAQLPRRHYGAVFSAAAFHWIDPEVSWEKAARVLAPGGTLALIQHCGLRAGDGADDHQALLSGLARIAPEIAASWPTYRELAAIGAGVRQRRDNVSEVWAWVGSHDVARAYAAALFGDVQIATVPTVIEQNADELNDLLRTASFYFRLSADQRQAIEREHVEMYERLGRPIRSSMVTVLVTARRGG